MTTRRAVFLDRDGTLNVDHGYVAQPDRVELIAGVPEGLRLLADAGFALVVASNQSGIARGFFTSAQADATDDRLRALLAHHGIELLAFYRCPHLPTGSVREFARECDCRKPKPGMLLRAAKEWNLDLSQSWAVGDRARDAAAAVAAGCRAVAVGPPHDDDTANVEPAYRARDLHDAARFIIEHP